MTDLFAHASERSRPKPLAALLRPTTLEDVFGQEKILYDASPLRRRIASGRLGSILLYGPPGTGKTSIARAIGAVMTKEFRQLHPAHSNVSDIKAVAQEARGKDLLVFVDEIHRFTSSQQDYLLALTEDGVFDFIGATTGNPYHDIVAALVSRSTIFKVEPLSEAAMTRLLDRAITTLFMDGIDLTIDEDTKRSLVRRAGGDGRRLVNAVESIITGRTKPFSLTINQDTVDEVYASAPMNFDRTGDQHYDITSAFVKSLRGSDPDAALFWLARLIESGEDPRYIARRLMVHSSEDIGIADSTALSTAVAAAHAVAMIGYPEAQIILAHATLHIARAPKSNSACRGIGLAIAMAKSRPDIVVPPHLRDGHYSGAKALGHVGYKFPHDDPRGWVEQTYAPGIEPGSIYTSDGRGWEGMIDEYWDRVKKAP